MKKSIIQTERECFICGRTDPLHIHHIFFGTSNRMKSDEDGCIVYLCPNHHTGKDGVHFNRRADLYFKVMCEKKWMEVYGKTEAEFIERYGKSYF